MKIKHALYIPAICAGVFLSGQVFADSVIHATPEGTTKFYPGHGSTANSTQRAQQELDDFKQNPISPDGQYRYVGGDQGWVLVPHAYAYSNGQWQHVDKLQHDTPAPSWQMTPEEKRQRDALYQGG